MKKILRQNETGKLKNETYFVHMFCIYKVDIKKGIFYFS